MKTIRAHMTYNVSHNKLNKINKERLYLGTCPETLCTQFIGGWLSHLYEAIEMGRGGPSSQCCSVSWVHMYPMLRHLWMPMTHRARAACSLVELQNTEISISMLMYVMGTHVPSLGWHQPYDIHSL